jgi:hypothetical protein
MQQNPEYVYKRSAPPPRSVPLSDDVAKHVLKAHAVACRECGYGKSICPCGGSGVVYCTGCGEVLLVASPPGPICVHAADLLWPSGKGADS